MGKYWMLFLRIITNNSIFHSIYKADLLVRTLCTSAFESHQLHSCCFSADPEFSQEAEPEKNLPMGKSIRLSLTINNKSIFVESKKCFDQQIVSHYREIPLSPR